MNIGRAEGSARATQRTSGGAPAPANGRSDLAEGFARDSSAIVFTSPEALYDAAAQAVRNTRGVSLTMDIAALHGHAERDVTWPSHRSARS